MIGSVKRNYKPFFYETTNYFLITDVVAHERLYEELSDCKVDRIEVQNARLSTHKITRTNKVQKELLQRLRLTKLLSSDFLKKVNPQYSA